MKIKIKKSHPNALTPKRAKDGDAAYDLFCIERIVIKPLERKIIPTAISIEIPAGYYGRIAPRSGLALKEGVDVLGGVIDSNYRGEIGVILINLNLPEFLYARGESESLDLYNHLFDSANSVILNRGDRVAQLIIERCYDADWEEVDELSDTERESGGFGSTGA